jgi:hypothetical protein
MAEALEPWEVLSFRKLLTSTMIEVQALVQPMVEKGIITEQEYFAKFKQVRSECQTKPK